VHKKDSKNIEVDELLWLDSQLKSVLTSLNLSEEQIRNVKEFIEKRGKS